MSSKTAPRILVFDSGVGGLSVAESIRLQHPHCSLIYASDNAAFPYGTKSEAVLVERVDRVLHAIQSQVDADVIVLACNTASTVALPNIRERFSLPIVGVVPAIKPAAQLSQTKVIGLLATPGTIARSYTHNLVQEFAQNCRIIPLGSSELVQLAEEKLRYPLNLPDNFSARLQALLEPFREIPNMDTVVLACTHFPLLKAELRDTLTQVTHWIDSGDAIARRVGYWLEQLDCPRPDEGEAPCHYSLFTQKHDSIMALSSALNNRGLGDIRFILLPQDD